VIVSGARREEQRWDASQNGQIVMECKLKKNDSPDLLKLCIDNLATEEMKKLATDAMFKLEYEGKDIAKKSSQSTPDLTELEIQQSAWKDDYIINYVLRKNLRVNQLNKRILFSIRILFSRKQNVKIVYKKKLMIV
jgi:coiled-coil domain-containing protein 130